MNFTAYSLAFSFRFNVTFKCIRFYRQQSICWRKLSLSFNVNMSKLCNLLARTFIYLFQTLLFCAAFEDILLKWQPQTLWWERTRQNPRETHNHPQIAGRPSHPLLERKLSELCIVICNCVLKLRQEYFPIETYIYT